MRLRRFLVLTGAVLCMACLPARAQVADGPSLMTAVRSAEISSGVSISKTFSYHLPVAERQAVVLSAEYVRMTTLPGELRKQLPAKAAWKFRALPVSVGYTYALTDPDRRLVPIVGAGVSYYFCRSKQLQAPGAGEELMGVMTTDDGPSSAFHKQVGMGYGAYASLGLRLDLNRHLFMLAQSRARYVNGLAFSGYEGPGSEFTSFDFALGFGFKL